MRPRKKNNNAKVFLLLPFYFHLSFTSVSLADFNPGCYQINFTGVKDFKPALITFINETAEDTNTPLPDHWDWRNVNGQNWLTPVTKQIDCGDCVMHAMASVFEGQLKINSGLSWITPRVSIAEGFHCGGGLCTNGWTGEMAIEKAKKFGFVDQACGEQVTSQASCEKQLCANASERRWKLQDYSAVTKGTLDINKIRTALLHGPVLTNMSLYDDFSCYKWGVYRHQSQTPPRAGHMLAIVGYNKSKKAWIVKNSWGSDWVEQGYGYIYEKDTSGFGLNSWSLYLPSMEGFVDMENIQDGSILKKEELITLRSNSEISQPLFFALTKNSLLLKEVSCLGPKCEIKINTLELMDGDYEVQSYSKNPESQQKEKQSLVKKIQILNKDPSVKFRPKLLWSSTTRANELRLSLKSLIKPTKLEVRLLNQKNELIYSQTTHDVSENMSLFIHPPLYQQHKGLTLETWVGYGNFPMRFLSKTTL